MKESKANRRKFIKDSVSTAAGIVMLSGLSTESLGTTKQLPQSPAMMSEPIILKSIEPRMRFSAIGLNHGHIYGQVEAIVRGVDN